ncbi:MAG: response regulator transcription factor [Actinocatenispora sp.]
MTPATGRGLVLVIEDEPHIADLIRMYLTRDGYGVQCHGDGETGLAAVHRDRPVAVVLDIRLPGIDGTEVCRRLRAEDDWTPILFLTAADDEVDRIIGLELGADDYLTKPFSPRELVARVRAVLRRTAGASQAHRVCRLGEVVLDPERRRTTVAGNPVHLTTTEFDLLAHLMARPGRVYTRDELLAAVWGYSAQAGTRTVDVHVAQIRGKLGRASPIRTVRGVGYAAEGDHG